MQRGENSSQCSGFDVAFRIFKSVLNHTLIEVQQDILKHGHVVQVKMAGSVMVFSDDPEVFRACMATQVCTRGTNTALCLPIFSNTDR